MAGRAGGRAAGQTGGRTGEEKTAFDSALGTMGTWYAHDKTTTVALDVFPAGWESTTPYGECIYPLSTPLFTPLLTPLTSPCCPPHLQTEDRGWTTVESAVSALVKASRFNMWARFVRASEAKAQGGVGGIFGDGGGVRPPPLHPEAFAAKLARKVFTNGKSDLEMVAGIYARTLDGALGGAAGLQFANCGWGDEEVKALAKVLPLARSATILNLSNNPKIGADGWRALAEAIAAGWLLCRAGVEIPDGILSLGTPMVGGGIEVPWGRHAAHAVVADADGARCISLEGAEIMHDRNIGREPRDSVAGVDIPAVADDSVWAAGALTRACQMVGAAAATLDLCVDYANARVQFGRPIGRFQAIQQQLAVMASEVAAAGVAARDACRAVDAGGDIHLAAASAKIRSGEAAGKAANIAHQVHGAIGFTYEYRLSHLTRRLWAWRSEFGAESEWAGWLGAQVIARGADRLWPDLTDRA